MKRAYNFLKKTSGKPVKVLLTLKTFAKTDTEIQIICAESSKSANFAIYVDRKVVGKGIQTVEISLPLAPKGVLAVRLNSKNMFEVVGFEVVPLIIPTFQASADTLGFFAHVLPILEDLNSIAPGMYVDMQHNHPVTISNQIKNRDTGAVMQTPARVSRQTGQVELSKDKMRNYSVSMRVFILCHERSHFELNSSDEIECDLNGLKWYLALGFPKIEAVYAATKVFNAKNPSDIQIQRTEILIDFIKNFNQETAQYDNGFC